MEYQPGELETQIPEPIAYSKTKMMPIVLAITLKSTPAL